MQLVEGSRRAWAFYPAGHQCVGVHRPARFDDEIEGAAADAAPLVEPIDEEPPEVGVRVVSGGQGQHDEPDEDIVCDDTAHPGHEGSTVDFLWEQRIGERLRHR